MKRGFLMFRVGYFPDIIRLAGGNIKGTQGGGVPHDRLRSIKTDLTVLFL